MYFELLKYYLYRTRFLMLSSLAYVLLFQLMGSIEGSVYTYSIMVSAWVASMYIAQTKDSHSILSSLPVTRNKIILADYSAYLINLAIANIVVFGLLHAQQYFNSTELTTKYQTVTHVLLFIAGLSSVIVKCAYDYFRKFGLWGGVTSIVIAIATFLGLTIFTLLSIKKEIFQTNLTVFLPGILVIFILFFVTKNYFKRLDF